MAYTETGKIGVTSHSVWSASTAYPMTAIVTSGGNAYISRKPVPAGTALTNTEYWDLLVNGSGGGTLNFDALNNRPKYNGTTMTHSTNIPEVKTSTWDGKQDKLIAGTNITIASDGKTISATGGGQSSFIVTISTTDGVNFTADKTYAQIMTAHNNGQIVIFSMPLGGFYAVANLFTDSEIAMSTTMIAEVPIIIMIVIRSNNTVYVVQQSLATT